MSTTRLTQHVNAPPVAVYRALLDPSAIAQWRVPGDMTSQVHHFEAREGGTFRVSLTYQDSSAGKSGEHTDTYHGRFEKLVPNELIVEVMEFETDDPSMRGEMRVTTLLREAPGGTEIEGIHENLPPGVRPEDNEIGWRDSFGKLAAYVERQTLLRCATVAAMPTDFRGIFAILATPFLPDESLDEPSLRRLVDWELSKGVHGLTILGIFGEFHRLTDAERDRVTQVVIKQVNGRVPVVVGISHNSARVAAEYAVRAQELGADGLMAAPSPYGKSAPAVKAYYRRIADVATVPLVLQDEPNFTGVQLPVPLLVELSESLPARYVKLEEAPTAPKVTALAKIAPDLQVFGGLGGAFFWEELARGAVGTMTGFAFPEILVRIYDLAVAGKLPEARDVFHQYLSIIRYENQPGISLALRKELLRKRGAMEHATVRQPAPGVDESVLAELDGLLAHLGLDPLK
jgi:4-hydroxy-tetrahydrodipicolinate synthase